MTSIDEIDAAATVEAAGILMGRSSKSEGVSGTWRQTFERVEFGASGRKPRNYHCVVWDVDLTVTRHRTEDKRMKCGKY